MTSNIALTFASLSLLAGCAVSPRLVSLHGGPDAVEIVHKHYSSGLTTYENIEIVAVDGKEIGSTYVGATVKMQPGNRRLTVRTSFKGEMGPEHEGYSTLTSELPASARLKLNGKVEDAEVAVWLEDANGKRVSSVSRGTWVVAPRHHTTIPIFIPMR